MLGSFFKNYYSFVERGRNLKRFLLLSNHQNHFKSVTIHVIKRKLLAYTKKFRIYFVVSKKKSTFAHRNQLFNKTKL